MSKRKETIYQYEMIFEPNGGGYTVTSLQLPGLVTEGDNLKKAREMAKDAIRCYLEALLKDTMSPRGKLGGRLVKKEKVKVLFAS